MGKNSGGLRKKAYQLAMLLVGLLFIPLGVFQYPAFILVGALYVFIGLRGMSGPATPSPTKAQSDKAQLESL